MLILYIFPIEAWDWVIFKYMIFRHFIKKKNSVQVKSLALQKNIYFSDKIYSGRKIIKWNCFES